MSEAVIIIPTASRPEMLALCLERLAALPDCPPVHISLDHVNNHLLEETTYIRDTRFPKAILHSQPAHVKVESGCWNILQSMRLGYEMGAEYIFMLEDDVQVYPYWLTWSLGQMATGEYLATCGRRIPAFFERYGDLYTNPGSCLRRDLLANLMPHIRDEYFAHPKGTAQYIRETFGREPFNSSLDDGLIRMVIWQMNGQCKYPDKPVCAHQGLDWYRKMDIFVNEGSIEDRIKGLREIHQKIESGNPRYARYSHDFESYNPTS